MNKENIVSEIKYYRAVLDALVDKVKEKPHSLTFTSVEANAPINVRVDSQLFEQKVWMKALEGRMHLGNLLKYVSDEEDPYRKATLERMSMETDYIPDPVDRGKDFHFPTFDNKVRTIDYAREVLDEIALSLKNIFEEDLQDIEDPRAKSHFHGAINNIYLCRNYCGKILYCIKQMKKDEC